MNKITNLVLKFGDWLYSSGEYRKAYAAYKLCSYLQSSNFEVSFAQVKCLLKLAAYSQAERIARGVLSLERSHAFLHELGRALGYQHRFDEAIECFQEAFSISPSSLESLFQRNSLLLKRGRFEEVLGCRAQLSGRYLEDGILGIFQQVSVAYFSLARWRECSSFLVDWLEHIGSGESFFNECLRLQSKCTLDDILIQALKDRPTELSADHFISLVSNRYFFLARDAIRRVKIDTPRSHLAAAQTYHHLGDYSKAASFLDCLNDEDLTDQDAVVFAKLAYQTNRMDRAIDLFHKVHINNLNEEGVLAFSKLLRRRGSLLEASQLLESSLLKFSTSVGLRNLSKLLESDLRVYKGGFFPSVEKNRLQIDKSSPILHVVEACLPTKKSGYTYRTQSILEEQVSRGSDIYVVTRPGFPWSIDYPKIVDIDLDDVPVGVRACHIDIEGDPNYNNRPLDDYLQLYADRLMQQILKADISLIHAHSNFKNGYAGIAVASAFGIPCVYEVRGFWEDSLVSKGVLKEGSDLYKGFRDCETRCMTRAGAVITLSQTMKSEIVSRGIEADKVFVVPNAVDLTNFCPQERDVTLVAKHNVCPSDIFIGYIGSFVEYEGLSLLVRAFHSLHNRNANLRLLLVGDGEVYADIESLVSKLNLQDSVTLTGRIPQREVERYYSLIDISVMPRMPHRVCELVTPLKPLEAMACKKVVVVSDLPALNELVGDGERGLCFEPGNCEHLVHVIESLISDNSLQQNIAGRAYSWVCAERKWSDVIDATYNAYEYVGSH